MQFHVFHTRKLVIGMFTSRIFSQFLTYFDFNFCSIYCQLDILCIKNNENWNENGPKIGYCERPDGVILETQAKTGSKAEPEGVQLSGLNGTSPSHRYFAPHWLPYNSQARNSWGLLGKDREQHVSFLTVVVNDKLVTIVIFKISCIEGTTHNKTSPT